MKAWDKFKIMQEALPLLGTMTDTALAKKLGVRMDMVTRWRKRAGIPRYMEQRQTTALPLLGTMKDIDLAKKLGVTGATIRRWRKEAGIPRYLVAARATHQTFKARIKELEAEVARLQNLNKEKAQ